MFRNLTAVMGVFVHTFSSVCVVDVSLILYRCFFARICLSLISGVGVFGAPFFSTACVCFWSKGYVCLVVCTSSTATVLVCRHLLKTCYQCSAVLFSFSLSKIFFTGKKAQGGHVLELVVLAALWCPTAGVQPRQ